MFDRILFPTDGRTGATSAVDRIFEIAESHGATLYLLNVADTKHDSVTRIGADVVDALEDEGEQIVAPVAERAADRGIDIVAQVLQGGVSETIAAYAEENEIDLIVMPTQGRRGVGESLIGSVTERVIRRAAVPVLALPAEKTTRYPYRDVLVPTDGSECATRAVRVGASMANEYDATLHLLSVIQFDDLGAEFSLEQQIETIEERANQIVAEATGVAERASVGAVVGATDRNSSVARAIREYIADNDIDLVVMGTHGRSGIERYLLGSVSEKVVRSAPIPVLTVPLPESSE